LLMC